MRSVRCGASRCCSATSDVPRRLERIHRARPDDRHVRVNAALRLRPQAQHVDRARGHLAQQLADLFHQLGVEPLRQLELRGAETLAERGFERLRALGIGRGWIFGGHGCESATRLSTPRARRARADGQCAPSLAHVAARRNSSRSTHGCGAARADSGPSARRFRDHSRDIVHTSAARVNPRAWRAPAPMALYVLHKRRPAASQPDAAPSGIPMSQATPSASIPATLDSGRRHRPRDHRRGRRDPRRRSAHRSSGTRSRAAWRRSRPPAIPLPAALLDSIRRTQLALKGPLATPVGGGFRSVNVRLREEFELYANVRPARTLDPGRALRQHRPRAGAREPRGAVRRASSTTSRSTATRTRSRSPRA